MIGGLTLSGSTGFAEPATETAPNPPSSSRTVDYAKDIQPIFERSCYECHGPEKQKSDFRLDQKAAAFKGGQGGRAILPGNSAESPLVRFVSGVVEDMRMPPPSSSGKALSSEEIARVRAWIDQGAQWPEQAHERPPKGKADLWVFKPASRPEVPKPGSRAWGRNEVDHFIAKTLEEQGLTPSAEADKRTLIRRATFDLIGLPPTREDVATFLADNSADAWTRVVDRLLASPQYGERWARHWLDTIHYGETHGYDKDKTRPNAWPYRDYVIRSLNLDKPYSRFVEEQLAGDVLFPDDPDGVVALGFLAAGPWDFVGHVELPESKTDGLIARYNDRDDMVMTTMSTFQSLTVHCARCHDHKFDPIPQEEYYNLQAVFAGVDRADRWFDPDRETFNKRKELLREIKGLDARRETLDNLVLSTSPSVFKLIDDKRADIRKQINALRKPGSSESPSNGYHSEVASHAGATKWVQLDFGRVLSLDEIRLIPARPTDFPDTPGFGFPIRFRVDTTEDVTFQNPQVLLDRTDHDYTNPGDQPVRIPAKGRKARLVRITAPWLWRRTGDFVFALAEVEVVSGGTNVASTATVTALDSIESGRWRKAALTDGYDSRKLLPGTEAALAAASEKRSALNAELETLQTERQQLVERLVDSATRTELGQVHSRLANLRTALAELPPARQVYAAGHEFSPSGNFKPAPEPRPVHLLRRGEVKQPIRLAIPGALSCVSGLPRDLNVSDSSEGSRRAALAKWIVTPENMLTRRSIVNRVWQYHFGRGLVETPNDFGHMGALPTHPELLDWLAYWFLDQGESLKKLHRLLLTSATYRQSSAHRQECATIDAENRFLWRMNRTRLDAESLRDSILFVAGRLDLTMGGPSVQQFYFKDDHSPVYDYTRFDIDTPAALRRSIYRFIVRSVPDPLMETLDCPDPSLLAPKRSTTVTALQALALLNDPLFLRQAEAFADRICDSGPDLRGQITTAYQLALSRSPEPDELSKLLAYTKEHGTVNLCRLIMNTSEFMFVD